MSVLIGVLAGWSVLRWLHADRRWPGRVLDLADAEEPAVAEEPTRPRRSHPASVGLERDLPAVVDLLHLAVTAGHSLHTAVRAVAAAGRGPASVALREVVELQDRGERLVDALEELARRHGPALRPLTTTLCVAASSGAPLAPALQRLADGERRRLRRRTEERVRRLPVLLLAPLIGLILPAFVVLTIVPVALTTATGIELPGGELPTEVLPPTVEPTRSPP